MDRLVYLTADIIVSFLVTRGFSEMILKSVVGEKFRVCGPGNQGFNRKIAATLANVLLYI